MNCRCGACSPTPAVSAERTRAGSSPPRLEARTVRRLVRSFGLLFIVAALVAGGVAAWAYWTFTRPRTLDGPTTVVVPRGVGLGDADALLRQDGVLGHAEVFAADARPAGDPRRVVEEQRVC